MFIIKKRYVNFKNMNSLKNMILKLEQKILLILLFLFTSSTLAQLSLCDVSSGARIY